MAFAAPVLVEQQKDSYRTAPQNVEAEQALLGAILVNNEAFYRVSDFLEPEHFFEPVHRRIYRGRRRADPRQQGRDAGHDQDLPAGRPRHRRHQPRAISRPSRRGGDDHHQRRGLRPHHLRPRASAARSSASARTWSTSPTTRRSSAAARHADRGGREAALRARRERPATTAASRPSRRRCSPPSTWRAPPTSATATCPASPPASTISTG